MSYDYLFKYIVIGDSGVGKSCILFQFLDKEFRQKHVVNIGVEFGAKFIQIDDLKLKLQIWDTLGQTFKCGTFIVYDVTNRQSFKNVAAWIEEAKQNGNQTMNMILVGNKTDLKSMRAVTTEEGRTFAEAQSIKFIETSAKTGEQIDDAFVIIAQEKKLTLGMKYKSLNYFFTPCKNYTFRTAELENNHKHKIRMYYLNKKKKNNS